MGIRSCFARFVPLHGKKVKQIEMEVQGLIAGYQCPRVLWEGGSNDDGAPEEENSAHCRLATYLGIKSVSSIYHLH